MLRTVEPFYPLPALEPASTLRPRSAEKGLEPWEDPKNGGSIIYSIGVLESRMGGSILHIICYTNIYTTIYTIGVLESRIGGSIFGSSQGSGGVCCGVWCRGPQFCEGDLKYGPLLYRWFMLV